MQLSYTPQKYEIVATVAAVQGENQVQSSASLTQKHNHRYETCVHSSMFRKIMDIPVSVYKVQLLYGNTNSCRHHWKLKSWCKYKKNQSNIFSFKNWVLGTISIIMCKIIYNLMYLRVIFINSNIDTLNTHKIC